jgi:hypothetical protein
MPINQTANLLAYFEQNAPISSQIAPRASGAYPPAPTLISSPFSTLPISGISTLSSPATIGTFITPQFATGVPGTMTYNNSYTDPNLPSNPISPGNTPTGFFTPNGSLLSLGNTISQPPNNLSPISSLPEGAAKVYKNINAVDPWRQSKILSLVDGPLLGSKSLMEVNYFDIDSKYSIGFSKGFTPGTQAKFVGISGAPGAMTYSKPITPSDAIVSPNLNTFASKYAPQANPQTRFNSIDAIDTEFQVNSYDTSQKKSLYQIYTSTNFAAMSLKFESMVKPYILRGIQSDKPNYNRVAGIPDSADEHKLRLEKAIDNSGFVARRKKLRKFQFQSRFQLGLGLLPHLFNGGPMAGGKLNLKKTDPLSMASSKAWVKGGSIARVPYSLINYSVINSLGFKYGLGGTNAIWKALNKLYTLLDNPPDDLIPFHFKVLHMDAPPNPSLFPGPNGTKTGYLYFRGTVKTISHSITPTWSSKKYFGRPDSVHTYSGFGQNFSFSFTIYAASRGDMKPMYVMLNALISMAKPGWDKNMSYMKGPITELTIGDYVKSQPGFIASLTVSPDEQNYWDLGKDPIKGLPQIAQVVPQGLIDSVPVVGANPPKGSPTNSAKIQERTNQNVKLPRSFNISITYTVIEKEMPSADGTPIWDTTKW